MDSQSTKDLDTVSAVSGLSGRKGTKRRRSLTDDPEESLDEKKRRESDEGELDVELTTSPNSSRDESGYQSDTSHTEVFHPAFRGCSPNTPSSPESSTSSSMAAAAAAAAAVAASGEAGVAGQNTMEIDQITSLVSIFSFGQHIMAAAAAATKKREFEEEEEEELQNEVSKTKKGKKSESSEDSDSESDTSSDSGHSSDDHEAVAREEIEQPSNKQTKLTRSVSTPDLCGPVSAGTCPPTSMASEAPPCVEVASL